MSVAAGEATHFVVTGVPSSSTAGGVVSFTVAALDSFGNTAVGYAGTVHLSTTDHRQSARGRDHDQRRRLFCRQFKTAGSQSVTANDTVAHSVTGTSNTISVTGAAATQYAVTMPSSTVAGTAVIITVAALDPYGNVSTNYTGSVHFASSDANAALPAGGTLANGTGTFQVVSENDERRHHHHGD